jgi:choline dehydrogenase-like flavoprotein
MRDDFDVLIVGSGPAGVSAAFPLLDAGLRVLMVDGGREGRVAPPSGQLLELRQRDLRQWTWMVGQDFHALRQADAVSPKLRVPTHADVFEGFEAANRINARDFIAVGSMARGGLSNAWGCGVAKLSAHELADFPFAAGELEPSYEAVVRRIGVSGAVTDDLTDYFGLDDWAQPPVALDVLQGGLLRNYEARRASLTARGFRLGRSRVAVLTSGKDGRQACDLSGNCLWGCDRRSLYSATEDMRLLEVRAGFHYRPGFIVERLVHAGSLRGVEGYDSVGSETLRARRVILAAGTLASTRLALQALGTRTTVPLQSCPTAAFMLWAPRWLGRARTPAFGLGQLSFALTLSEHVTGFGSLFDTTGIPVTEFARYIPLGKRNSIDILSGLLSSCVAGNLFLPGRLSKASLRLDSDTSLHVRGAYGDEVAGLMALARHRLRLHFVRLGAMLMPSSFTIGQPGGDIHYACSLPMRHRPVSGETDAWGELAGCDGVHVVDGASLPTLVEKSHTLTIMANADRIGRHLAREMVKV